jgi:hypothetical protein
VTHGADTGGMAVDQSPAPPPLASYVLRVSGRPAVLRYELHNVRTGERHRFTRADALADFLRQQGLEPAHVMATTRPAGGGDGGR